MPGNLQSLIAYIDNLVGKSNGLAAIGESSGLAVESAQEQLGQAQMLKIKEYLGKAELTAADVAPFRSFSEKSYQRNLIKKTAAYELLLLCWMSGQASPIHDHFGSRCVFRIIEGKATEVKCEDIKRKRHGVALVRPSARVTYSVGEVCMSESLDIHEVANREGPAENLVTLHLYSPPLHMRIYQFE